MFHACFQLLEDCVEKEKLFDNFEVPEHLKSLYKWWKEVKDSEDFDSGSQDSQAKLELLIKHRQFLWT